MHAKQKRVVGGMCSGCGFGEAGEPLVLNTETGLCRPCTKRGNVTEARRRQREARRPTQRMRW